jgi:hypothetical protein
LVFVLRFVVFNFQESPKFLLGKGRDEAAIEVVRHVATVNRRDCGLNMGVFRALEEEHRTQRPLGAESSDSSVVDLPGGVALKRTTWAQKAKFELLRIRILFSSALLTRLTLLVWVIYAFDYWGFSIAGESHESPLYSPTFTAGESIEHEHRN